MITKVYSIILRLLEIIVRPKELAEEAEFVIGVKPTYTS